MMSSMEYDDIPARKRGRSPSHPAINLEEAVGRARKVYEAEGRNAAPVDVLAHDMEYTPGSGTFAVVISALGKFGLMEFEGSGKARIGRLSDLGLEIVLDDRPDSVDRQKALSRAALRPKIHSLLWDEYGVDLPSDSTLRFKLLRELGFTKSAVDDFIQQYRDTLEYAGLFSGVVDVDGPEADDRGQSVARPAEVTLGNEQDGPASPLAAQGGRAQAAAEDVVAIPILNRRWVRLSGPFPVAEQDWSQMMRVLEAMKPGLVTSSDEDDRLLDTPREG